MFLRQKKTFVTSTKNVAIHLQCSHFVHKNLHLYTPTTGTLPIAERIHIRLPSPLPVPTPILQRKKSISPSHLWGVDYITPNLWNGLYHPLNFEKPVKLPPKTVSKNYSKSQKNHKIKNSIVLDSKWVDLHSEHIIWYALIIFLL